MTTKDKTEWDVYWLGDHELSPEPIHIAATSDEVSTASLEIWHQHLAHFHFHLDGIKNLD